MFQAEGGVWQWCCLPGAADMGAHSPGAESVCVCGWRGGWAGPELEGLIATFRGWNCVLEGGVGKSSKQGNGIIPGKHLPR